jgi:hypothetical protein
VRSRGSSPRRAEPDRLAQQRTCGFKAAVARLRCVGAKAEIAPKVFAAREASAPFGLATPGQDRRPPLRRPGISLSQGAEWKALISKYIGLIPLSDDPLCAAEQNISGEPSARTPVINAMIAKAGEAARHSQSAAPKATAPPLRAQVPAAAK